MIDIQIKSNIKLIGKKITILGAGKSGIAVAELLTQIGAFPFISEISDYKRIKIRGLMSLPEIKLSLNEQRKSFSVLKNVFNQLRKSRPELDTLSMGTTQDMEAANAEGATFVRIGTAIFGPRNN